MALIQATLVYLIHEDKVLMIHRNRKEGDEHKGKYNGLGGKFEAGETGHECAIREVFEESGLQISRPNLKGDILFPKFDKKGNDWHVFIYTAFEFSGELISQNREGDLEWVKISDVMNLNLWEGDKHFLPYVFTDKTFKGTFYYKNGELDKDKAIELKIVG